MKFNSNDSTIGWVGNGAVLVSALDANDKPVGGWRNVGQVSSATAALTSEEITMADTMRGTLADAQSMIVKNDVEVALTMKSFIADNMALALFGESILDPAVLADTYSYDVVLGSLEVLPGVIQGNVTVIRDSDSEDVTENFTVNGCSISTPADQSGFDFPLIEGDTVTVTYDRASVKRIEAFSTSYKNVAIVFDGFNLANEDKNVKVTYHKVSLKPAAQRQLISADYADQEISGKLLASNNVSGAGLSKLFKEEHVV